MANDSPAIIIYNSDGYELTVKNTVAIPVNTPTIIMGGSDGTNARYITLDSLGRQVVVGSGTPGSNNGGIITIQGDPLGVPVPVSGSFSNPSIGINGTTIPNSSTQIGGSDGTNLRVIRVFDLDTDIGSEYNIGISLRLPSSGGSVAGGTFTNPIRTDPTGNTTQPISGTITVIQSTASNLLANVGGLGAANNTIVGNPILIGGSDGTNIRNIRVDNTGQILTATSSVISNNSTLNNISASISNITLLPSNVNRLGAIIYNDSNNKLYIKLGTAATLTSFTVQLFSQGYYEVPANYVGQIDGIWDGTNGAARVTELT